MKRAIVLAGVSGVGKTRTRLNDPELKGLPYLDIADVYRQFPGLDWMEPFWALVKLVFVNQAHSMIGVMYGNPETTPGGSALRFYASVRVRVSRVSNLGPKGKEYGVESRAKVVKNSLAAPFREATFEIVWGQDICHEADVLAVAAEAGVIAQIGRTPPPGLPTDRDRRERPAR